MIIGLVGKARSGKDTVADFLTEAGFVKRAFADPLKAAVREIFGLTLAQTHGADKEKIDAFWGCTPREILQKLGTECLRNGYAPDVWIRVMERWSMSYKKVVIPDVRFRNEAEAIVRWGGKVWKIERPGAGATGGVPGHIGENDLDGWEGFSRVIKNEGSLDYLKAEVEAAVKGT